MSAVLAPIKRTCLVCSAVADIGDVNVRMFDDDGTFTGYADAREYLRGMGMAGSTRMLRQRLQSHREHVEDYLLNPHPVAAFERGNLSRLPDRPDVGFLSVQQRALSVGSVAFDVLEGRVDTMESQDLIGVARLGLSAAAKRADMASKGREIQAEALARLAAGFSPEVSNG